jgi:hypothetical protein
MSKLLASAAAHRGGLVAAPPGREAVERNELMRALQLLLTLRRQAEVYRFWQLVSTQ